MTDKYLEVTSVGASASPIQEQFDRLTAERDKLQALVKEQAGYLRASIGLEALAKAEAERDALRAELVELKVGASEVQADSIHRYSQPLCKWPVNPDGPLAQLRELRAAVDVHIKGHDNPALLHINGVKTSVEYLRAVLAKVSK